MYANFNDNNNKYWSNKWPPPLVEGRDYFLNKTNVMHSSNIWPIFNTELGTIL